MTDAAVPREPAVVASAFARLEHADDLRFGYNLELLQGGLPQVRGSGLHRHSWITFEARRHFLPQSLGVAFAKECT